MMTTMRTAYAAGREANIVKFQQLLRELFQFDCADLDFGIYRIMNHKRDAVERFIVDKLPHAVSDELGRGALEEEHQAVAALEEATLEVKEGLGSNAIDDDGELASNFHDTPLGKRYLKARSRVHTKGRSQDAIETDIYNHLYTFFSRYYEDGDFISKRRYSRRQQYAIPYNGEEVYLHWANSDQYYVKTGEHFNDYDWIATNGVKVHFQLKTADVEHNNVKGDKRFFIPRVSAIQSDPKSREVTIPFEYRPLNSRERNQHGNTKQQEKIITESVCSIPENAGSNTDILSALTGERHRNGNDESVTHLEYQLRRYTRRNTSDFFIHKDLKGFLSRELDFYLKNEVLNLDDLSTAGGNMADGWFQMMRLIKLVGTKIIDFLAQIENFQKMLWEKRKFITETQYCITIGNIDADFYPEIADNDAQWDEWRELFGINGADRSKTFLEFHPTLVLDTRHFSSDFIDRLLASFEDLDEMTDGLLVHSENWQALNLFRYQYDGRIKCIYIDPPFNTGTNEFLYKNNYLNSSWLTMLSSPIFLGKQALSANGNFFCRIDHHGDFWIRQLLDRIFGETRYQNQMVLKRGRETAGTRGKLEIASETIYWFSANDRAEFNQLDVERSVADVQWTAFLMGGERNPRERVFFGKSLTPPDGQHFSLGQPKVDVLLKDHFLRLRCMSCGSIYFYADNDARLQRTMKRRNNRYKYYDITPDKIVHGVQSLQECIECGDDEWRVDYLGAPTVNLSNLWLDIESYARTTGFFTENSEALLRRIIELSSHKGEYVLDFFLGSGTTVATAHKLGRKWIGVEVGEYFDIVPLLRVKKVLFGDKGGISKEISWNGGGMFKYIRLESYEDALNSIGFDNTSDQLNLEEQIEDYLLKYMLQWETKDSETLLNVEQLSRPFTYRLKVRVDGETQERVADIPETFNYLLGLNVRTRRVYDDDTRRYLVYRGETRESPGWDMVVIWRETEEWEEADFERDREFVANQKITDGADSIYVNSSSCIIGAKSVDPLFKERMFAGTNA